MKKLIILLIFIAFTTSSIFAQLITATKAAQLSKSKNTIIVSARKHSDYTKVHIKNAVNVDISKLETKKPVEGMLKSTTAIASILGKAGISRNKTILVYCNTGVNAGRLYWILKYMGCPNVYMINGHMKGWRAARKAVTRTATKVSPTTFKPVINKSILVNKSYVKSKLNSSSTVIVDVRKKEKYDAGHIGKAINIPHKKFLSDTKIKSTATCKSIFTAAGVTSDKEIILYCKSSARAGLLFFILKEQLKYPNVKVYDGAYNEWK
ncbi:MAG: rhodanese-like domain-containing protein [Bacteroidota bacterium]|nr:rhodanese-like domain-containing protein [Bacteroidota bacterium]